MFGCRVDYQGQTGRRRTCNFNHVVELSIVMRRIMMEQKQASCARIDCELNTVRQTTVAPTNSPVVFIRSVLGIENQQIDAANKFDQSALG